MSHKTMRDGTDEAPPDGVATAGSNEKAPRILTIDRSKWRRGALGRGDTALLNHEGFMCCLGFDALACGVSRDAINGAGDPKDIPDVDQFVEYAGSARFIHERCELSGVDDVVNSRLVLNAIKLNDNKELAEPERERLIREALIELGWDDVVFIDGDGA